MTIRNKILVYFSASTILLVGLALLFIYILFYEYREEEFQQRQKDKVTTSLTILSHIKESEHALIGDLDVLDINKLLDEKLLIFDHNKTLIYTSIDDTPISFSKAMVAELSVKHPWIEGKDGNYDVVGMYFVSDNQVYYGISKAYDAFGYSKLNFLKWVLLITYLSIIVAIVLVSRYLAKLITKPIEDITQKIQSYDLEEAFVPIEVASSKSEIVMLVQQFNKLMKRLNDSFSFQKHAIHHISHELKTPIAILVSNFERMERMNNMQELQLLVTMQKEDTKNLSEIINALLEIAKAESDDNLKTVSLRIDEMIFDLVEELSTVYPQFKFTIEYQQENDDATFEVHVNPRLFKSALLNLMHNCILYSSNSKAHITIINIKDEVQVIFENEGEIITAEELPYLFQHFFRGTNSQGKRGFGLGLVFLYKILKLHKGTVSYLPISSHTNQFKIILPVK